MGDATTEVIYEAPGRTRAWWVAAFGALVFFAGLAWIVARMIRSPAMIAVTAVIVALALAAPTLLGQRGPLRAKRVVADGKTVRVEHRRGVEEIAYDDIASAEYAEVTLVEGVPLDAVVLRRKAGGEVTFSVLDRGAAEGAARAIRAVTGLDAKPAEG